MARRVEVIGYASECEREKGKNPQVKRVVETRDDLESAARELYDQDYWLSYGTTERKAFASKKDALAFLVGR